MSITNPKFYKGTMMKLAMVPETAAYGVDGSAVWPGADDMFPADCVESFTKEIVYKERGQIGLDGGKHSPVKVGETIAGGLTCSLYFDSDPLLLAIATVLGEEKVSGSDPYTHDFRFGINFSGSISDDYEGALHRHGTFAIDAKNANYVLQGTKFSSVAFTCERDTGVQVALDGVAYKSVRQTTSGSTAWSDRSTVNDLVQTGNDCTFSLYVCEYAADKTISSSDKIRAEKCTAKFDQANEAKPDTGTAGGIGEPTMTPSGREVNITFTVDYGDTDDNLGRRDWTDAYNDNTALMFYLNITATDGKVFRVRVPRVILDGPGKPVVDGPDTIAMEYTGKGYMPEETLTNSFAGLTSHSGDARIVNDRALTYMK